jgi:Na+-transporting NADH:ubiquinone oxidoreductase subunit B
MQFLRDFLDQQAHHFKKGGKLEALYPFYEANDTLLFTPGEVTHGNVHVRDALDLKRMMITVVVALLPCVLMAMYNTGYQSHLAVSQGATPLYNWQEAIYGALGLGYDHTNILANLVHGALYFVPVFAMTFLIGGHIEVAFALVRKHEINEGFLVTGFLFPLTLPPTIPLWQVAIGIAFGVIIGKEVFGGTGMNVLNPALTARAFLFFAYPADISGEAPWVAADLSTFPDGVSGATYLAQAAAGTSPAGIDGFTNATVGSAPWLDAFFGLIPGSMGETSTIACLIGAAILIFTQIGSWRTMLGVTLGTLAMSLTLNLIGSQTNPMFEMTFLWHIVMGGWAFGTVFMATDPVSSSFTEMGKLIYGALIGVLIVLVRVVNPAYPEGVMLAILFMNMFAPLIDHFFVQANIKRRMARHAV